MESKNVSQMFAVVVTNTFKVLPYGLL